MHPQKTTKKSFLILQKIHCFVNVNRECRIHKNGTEFRAHKKEPGDVGVLDTQVSTRYNKKL